MTSTSTPTSTSPAAAAVGRWHRYVESRDVGLLDGLLADDVVFRSPVVHTPQHGTQVTTAYLSAAMTVLDGADGEDRRFRYVGQLVDGHRALLEFETRLGDVSVHGVDLLTVDDAGRITEFTVMVRPLKAVHAIWEAMGAQLARSAAAPSG